jgi:parvulin-like peptidyl-prolyl isomerase
MYRGKTMKKLLSMTVVAVLVLGLFGCSGKGKTLVTVNGKGITEGDLDFLSNINPRLKMQLSTPFGKKQILDNMVEQELMYQAATKRGLQRDSIVKAKIDLYKKVIIAQAFIESEMEKRAKEYYEKNKGEFEKLQLSQILVKFAQPKDDKAKGPAPKDKINRSKDAALKIANDIKKRLDGGEDFAKLAKEFSDDPTSKNVGGDLGKVSKADPRLERKGYGPLLEKAFTMQVGETAGPIETPEGYHVITVTKGVELQPYDEVAQAVMMKVQGEERNKILADVRKDAKVVFADEKKKEEAKPAEAKPGETPPASAQPGAANAPAGAPPPPPPPPAPPAPPAPPVPVKK